MNLFLLGGELFSQINFFEKQRRHFPPKLLDQSIIEGVTFIATRDSRRLTGVASNCEAQPISGEAGRSVLSERQPTRLS